MRVNYNFAIRISKFKCHAPNGSPFRDGQSSVFLALGHSLPLWSNGFKASELEEGLGLGDRFESVGLASAKGMITVLANPQFTKFHCDNHLWERIQRPLRVSSSAL